MKPFRLLPLLAVAMLLWSLPAASQTSARIQAENLFVESQKAISRGDYQAAEDLLMQSLQKDATFTSAIWQLALIYEKRGQLEHARELIIRGLQQEPQAVWAKEKLVDLERALLRKLLSEAEDLMSSGGYERAIPKLSLYLGIRPFDPQPLVALGRCHLALGNLEMAKEYFTQALERDPSNKQIAALLDNVQERLERSSVDALVRKAQTILENYSPDRRDEAREALEAVLAQEPGNSYAREKLEELNNLAAGRDAHGDVEQVSQKNPEAVSEHKKPFARVLELLVGNILTVVIGAVAVFFAYDIKRRNKHKSYPLGGSLNLIPILDIVSLLNSNLKTGRLVVQSGEALGEIFFEKGEIVHARLKGWDGKNAFNRIMEFRSGKYYFKTHLPNVRHTISEPLSLLLLSMKSREVKETHA